MAAQLFTPLQRAMAARPDVALTAVVRQAWTPKEVADRSLLPIMNTQQANRADVIFVDAPFAFTTEAWNRVRRPVAALFEDLHGPLVGAYMGWWLHDFGLQHPFVRYREPATAMPELAERHPVWLPHAIDPAVFREQGPWEERDITILASGRTAGALYRFRAAAHRALHKEPGFLGIRRPADKPGAWPTGREYATLLAGSKIGLQGTALGYVTAKTVEIPACGAALLTTWEPEMADLGFRPDHNCIVADEATVRGQARRWLWDDDGLRALAAAGRDLVHSRHTTAIRAEQLVTELRRIAWAEP